MSTTPYHLTRLLVAVQSFDDADIALRWGRTLASALYLPLTLVHVLDESRVRGDIDNERVIAQDWLNLLASNPELHNIEVDTDLRIGRVEEELSALGEERPGSIVLFVAFPGATNGPAALGRSLDTLILAMRSPFVVVPSIAQVPTRARRIVVGMDRSSLAARVLATARRLAQSLDVEVIAVEAIEPGTLPPSEFTSLEPVVREDQVRIRGLASRVLISTAQARDASMIAVGSHGAGASRHALMGSTSEWLSQHADRPVLIVPDDR